MHRRSTLAMKWLTTITLAGWRQLCWPVEDSGRSGKRGYRLSSMNARPGLPSKEVLRQEPMETSQLAVDTHGYTDFAMALARRLGFDLFPRLKELKQRHLFVPRGMAFLRRLPSARPVSTPI